MNSKKPSSRHFGARVQTGSGVIYINRKIKEIQEIVILDKLKIEDKPIVKKPSLTKATTSVKKKGQKNGHGIIK